MTNEKAIMCLEDMKIKVPIPKAAKQARENNEALDVAIKALQSAEPKRGWWIEIINSRGVVVALRCSRCEKSPRHGVRSDYCPNCGADMRGEQDG